MEGRPIDQALDGDVAFDVAPGGAARRLSSEVATRRRMELLANPIVAVRAALDSRSRVANRRTEGTATLVDVTTAAGETFTLAVTTSTGLPLWVRWVGPHENLGDLTYRAEFSGYEPVDGVLVPMSFNSCRTSTTTCSCACTSTATCSTATSATWPRRRPCARRRSPCRPTRSMRAPVAARRVALVRQRRRQFRAARVRGSSEPVRSADEPRVDGGAHRQSARHGAGQARDGGHHLAPSLRSHRRAAHGDRRRPHDRHAGRQRRLVRGSRAAAASRRFRMR